MAERPDSFQDPQEIGPWYSDREWFETRVTELLKTRGQREGMTIKCQATITSFYGTEYEAQTPEVEVVHDVADPFDEAYNPQYHLTVREIMNVAEDLSSRVVATTTFTTDRDNHTLTLPLVTETYEVQPWDWGTQKWGAGQVVTGSEFMDIVRIKRGIPTSNMYIDSWEGRLIRGSNLVDKAFIKKTFDKLTQ